MRDRDESIREFTLIRAVTSWEGRFQNPGRVDARVSIRRSSIAALADCKTEGGSIVYMAGTSALWVQESYPEVLAWFMRSDPPLG